MFNNLRELVATMPDEETCRKYLIKQRWDDKPLCPFCGCGSYYVIDKGRRYKCSNNVCNMKYSVTTNTIFHNSKIPLNKWLMACYIVSAHKKGISSYQLAKDIGCTQRTAWFIIHRIREAMKAKQNEMLDMVVEIDETYVGAKMKNKHKDVRDFAHKNNLNHAINKTGVMGYLQRKGEVKLVKMQPELTVKEQVFQNIKPEAIVLTDGYPGYFGLDRTYEAHLAVDHAHDEYVRGFVHTNGIEGAFSHFKRMVYGIYHQITPKHLQAYCNEFSFRFNSRELKDKARFELLLNSINCRLTYKSQKKVSIILLSK